MEKSYDVVVIGGGPAGLAAAVKASSIGLNVLVIEKSQRLGGIPLQCIHPGFGIHYFHEDLTGPEFVYRFINLVEEKGIDYLLETYVEDIEVLDPMHKLIHIVSPSGVYSIEAKTIIYATGARERHRYEILVPGANVSGVYTAGEAQAMMDLYGIIPGKRVLIVGSGDVGLIMARRFALEGVEVVGVVEIMPYPGGLMRNIVQCLQDFNIPLYLSHALIEIRGHGRVEEVVIARVDENLEPIPGTEKTLRVDTVVVAAGLIPRVELLERIGVLIDPATRGPIVNDYLETNIPGIFVAGNALVVNDFVDYAVEQGELAAISAKIFIENNGVTGWNKIRVIRGRNIRLIVPQFLSGDKDVVLYGRVSKPLENPVLILHEVNHSIPYPVLRPPEMFRIRIRRSELSGIDKLTIEAVER